MIIDFCTAQNGLQPATVWFYIRSRTYFLLADHFGPHHLAEPRRGTYADVSLDWLKIIVLFIFLFDQSERRNPMRKEIKKKIPVESHVRNALYNIFSLQ